MLLFTGDRRDEKAITAALNERLAGSTAEPHAANEAGTKQYDVAPATQVTLKEVAGSLG